MRAAVFRGPGRIAVEAADDPAPAPGDLLVRVRAATVCGTDIRIFRGRKTAGVRTPSVLGHEFAGEVVDAGGREGFAPGDRIGLCPAVPCGACERCARGRENLCAHALHFGYEIDGGFAELVRVPARAVGMGCVRRLPEAMTYGEAALIEPLACVLNGQERVGVGLGDTVAVLGAGPIGLMHVMLARLRGAGRVIASDPNPSRRAAAARCGADATIDPSSHDVRARVMAETGGRGADVVICAIGVPALARQATDLVAHGGRVSLFAGFSAGETAEMDVNAIHYSEITVTGAFGLTRRAFHAAFDMVASGRLDVAPLVTDTFALGDIGRALETAESGAALKVAIVDG